MYYPIRTIVAGVSDIDGPDPILVAALQLAERTGATLHAVHAFDVPNLIWDAYLEAGMSNGGVQEEIAEAHARALEATAKGLAGSRTVHCYAVRDTPEHAVNTLAERVDADLVVIGATHHGAVARQILGTTAQRVLRHAFAPVLVLRGALPDRFGRVLFATDLSPLSATAHEVGLDVVETLSTGGAPEVEAMLAVRAPRVPAHRIQEGALGRRAAEELGAFLELRRARSLTIHPRVRFGDAAHEITREAKAWRADLVVLGTHSRTGVTRLWLGSVAEAVLRDVHCSALVIPVAAAERVTLPVARAAAALEVNG